VGQGQAPSLAAWKVGKGSKLPVPERDREGPKMRRLGDEELCPTGWCGLLAPAPLFSVKSVIKNKC
jgi:hypothetical protein